MLTLREGWVAEWLPLEGDENRKGFQQCSRCAVSFKIEDWAMHFYKYCPHCGSWMKGEK